MNDPLDPMVSPKAKVLRMLRHGIETGSLAPGDPVPSEKTLSEHLNVTRSAVRAAFELLETEGLVRMQGKGRVVTGAARDRSQSVVLLAGGYTGPQPTYQQSPNWAIHVQLVLEARLRAVGCIARPVPFTAVSSHFERSPAEQPVAVIFMCDGGIDPGLSRLLETLPHGPRIFYAANLEEPMCAGADTVAVDHASGGAALVDWFVANHRRTLQRVWFQVWNHSHNLPPWLARRDEGMRAAAQRHGLILPPAILLPWLRTPPRSDQFEHYWQLGVLALAGALAPNLYGPQPCDGLVMMHDTGAVQAWSALAQLGDDVAGRLLVAGHDALWNESPEMAFQPRPPSVTIGRHMPAVGDALADLVLARLGGTAPVGRQTRLIQPQLVLPEAYSVTPT